MFSLKILSNIVLVLLVCATTSASTSRKLTAAPKRYHLKRGTADFQPNLQDLTLHYVDEYAQSHSALPLAASLSLEPKLPALILEDVEEHFHDVTCSDGDIAIRFRSASAMEAAFASWNVNLEMLFITSHQGCTLEGAHSPYIVSLLLANDSTQTIVLQARKTSLKQSCHKISVEMGEHVLTDIDSKELKRRFPEPQSQSPTTTSSSNIQSASSSLSVSFNFTTPTAVPTSVATSKDVSFSHIDTALVPPDGTIASLLGEFIPPPANLNLTCLNCSMTGSFSLQAAGFSIVPDPDMDDKATAVIDFFESGYLQFNATNMFANMSFELAFLPGFKISKYTARLPDIPLGAFEIQDVLAFGPVMQFTFPMDVTLNSPVTFKTGFTLEVPPDSTLILNVSDISSSSSRGFQDAKLTPLAFNANAENLSVNFSAGFQPKIVLGTAIFQDVSSSDGVGNPAFHANGGVGAYLDLPQLIATVSQVNNTNDHCESSSSSSNNGQTYIHVEPSTNLAAGIQWNLDVGAVGVNFQRGGGMELYKSSHPLPTECLKWDSKSNSMVAASSSPSSSAAASCTPLKGSWLGIVVMLAFGIISL